MPRSRISSAVSGRAVIWVTSSLSITSISTCSGDPWSSTSPPLTSRMFSSVWMPAIFSAGIWNGVLGRVTRSSGPERLGPRSVARTSASAANGGTAPGSVGACRNTDTMVAMSRGTTWRAGSTFRPSP